MKYYDVEFFCILSFNFFMSIFFIFYFIFIDRYYLLNIFWFNLMNLINTLNFFVGLGKINS